MTAKTPTLPRRRLLAGSAATLAAGSASAQALITRPIRLVVGYSPGGAVDIIARLIALKLGGRFNQTSFVENRPGANSTIGADNVARSAPDGSSILVITSTHVMTPAFKQHTPYDPITSFAPITAVATVPNVVLVRPGLGIRTLQDFVTSAKASPGKLNYASTGIGSATSLIVKVFEQTAGVRMTEIPYQGAGPALTSLLSGEVDAYFGSVSGAKPYVDEGKMVALAVPQATRATLMPNVPTTAEAGLPAFQFSTWYGLLAPAKTPQPIIDRLNSDVHDIVRDKTTSDRLAQIGAELFLDSPAEFHDFMVREMERVNETVRQASGVSNQTPPGPVQNPIGRIR